jgi:hypothetical protein
MNIITKIFNTNYVGIDSIGSLSFSVEGSLSSHDFICIWFGDSALVTVDNEKIFSVSPQLFEVERSPNTDVSHLITQRVLNKLWKRL